MNFAEDSLGFESQGITFESKSYTDLETSGYTVIRNFLSPVEVEAFRHDIEEQETRLNMNYRIKYVSDKMYSKVRPKLEFISKEVEKQTSITTNNIGIGVYFSTEGGQAFEWHQDHESFFICQTHNDQLNIYIPIIKPVREKSNVCVVPFDKLYEKSPDICGKIQGGGATRWRFKNGKTRITDDANGGKIGYLDYDIEELAVAPELEPGDLLLMRGDVVHRTQDAETMRVAVSVRMVNDKRKIHKGTLVHGGLAKLFVMIQNRESYLDILDAFRFAKSDEIELGQLLKHLDNDKTIKSESKLKFLLRIIGYRLFGPKKHEPA